MSGDGRDDPRGGGGGGADGGAERGGTPSRQVPNQGGPKEVPGSGGPGAPGGQAGPAGPRGAGGPSASGGFSPSGGPAGLAGPGGSAGAGASVPGQGGHGGSGRPGGHGGGVPMQREGGSEPTIELPVVGPPASEPSAPELSPSDADLIQRVRGGDDSAYEELFRRHAEAVRRYARTCCRDAHTADDLTAEVFARTLQAVRGGAGPEQAVRAYLLTTVRRVAASWTRSARREQLVEDFAAFAVQAARASEVLDADTLDLGADVKAMHEAEQSMAMQAFRSLPERWQAVLWHTTVEEESPSEVAPLFGLTANATAVLAGRAREGLKQAYLQAHVSAALTSGGDCSRYADRLGAYARGGLRMRAERGLRKHLEECSRCRLAVSELELVNAGIPALIPIAVIGWFAAGYTLKAAGIVAGGAAGVAGAGAAVAGASGGGASGGAAGGAALAEGVGTPVKAGVAGVVAVAAAAGLVWALVGDHEPAPKPDAKPPVAAPLVPGAPAPSPKASEPPAPSGPGPAPSPSPKKHAPSRAPKPTPPPTRKPTRKPAPPVPAPSAPAPAPTATPKPPPPPVPAVYQVNQLAYGVLGDGSGPEVRLGGSGWLWQRSSLSIGGTRYGHGVTMHALSSVTIDLNRDCETYEAVVGVDDLTLGLGAVRFSVYGDGGRLWQSPVLRGGDPAVPVQVGIAGQRTIRLAVEPHTPFDVVALADWARSRITCR
ncbi:sigma-70 family RNA polymerase sigma factor [Streptomyces sp. NPDC051569]|uniref:sigma-70 family RNA polymerase sigma factor n=1 Tax=Streptomyces sp. NPDC051569 TaxID=3365661 RepID=UPI0037B752FA